MHECHMKFINNKCLYKTMSLMRFTAGAHIWNKADNIGRGLWNAVTWTHPLCQLHIRFITVITITALYNCHYNIPILIVIINSWCISGIWFMQRSEVRGDQDSAAKKPTVMKLLQITSHRLWWNPITKNYSHKHRQNLSLRKVYFNVCESFKNNQKD